MLTWVNPLITTPTQQSTPNHNPQSNRKPSHPAQQHPTLPLPALPMSRFAYPNPFSSLQHDPPDSDDDDVDRPLPLTFYPRDSSGLSLTTPVAFTFSLLCSVLCVPPDPYPAPGAALSSVSLSCLSVHSLSSPLIADSGCTGILVQQSNFPAPSPVN
jgi:hypothetical protein